MDLSFLCAEVRGPAFSLASITSRLQLSDRFLATDALRRLEQLATRVFDKTRWRHVSHGRRDFGNVRSVGATNNGTAEPAIPAARRPAALHKNSRLIRALFSHSFSVMNWHTIEPESLVAQPSSDTDEEYDQVSDAYAKAAVHSTAEPAARSVEPSEDCYSGIDLQTLV